MLRFPVGSGKSTFINYVVGQNIQKTGVAPTDDSFTVVIPGHTTADQDGPAVCIIPHLSSFFSLLRMGGLPVLLTFVALYHASPVISVT